MASDRAGYTVVVYAIDVSPSMASLKSDPGQSSEQGSGKGKEKGKEKSRLDWTKELVARLCEPKITSGRKTEAVGVLSFGGANKIFVEQRPDDQDPPYSHVSCDVSIQTAKPKILEVVMNLEQGYAEGNPVSALMVALDMIHVHKHTKAWALEIVLITDGETPFSQDEYEEAMNRLDEMGVKLSVIGIDFQPENIPVDKNKSRNKRLSEKFWRVFTSQLHERMFKTVESYETLPQLSTFDSELLQARKPRVATINGTVSGTHLYIGSAQIDPEEAIGIQIKYSKATMKARPPAFSKAWKPAMELQAPQRMGPTQGSQVTASQGGTSHLLSSLIHQSGGVDDNVGPDLSEIAAMISADVKHHSTYVIKKGGVDGDEAVPPTQATQAQVNDQQEEEDVEDEEVIAKEDLVKAWRFGSTWVPMEADTFEPLHTQKGVEILGFFPKKNIRRHMLMGEVRFVWPDLTSPKAQIQFSSLVAGMILRDMVAVVRWVIKDDSEPSIGLCIPEQDFGQGEQLDYMFWVKLPFAEDEHNFWFPSLERYKTASGKQVTEHPFIPTTEQCALMDDLVAGMDLDTIHGADEDEAPDQDEDVPPEPWFDPSKSYNPVIHRIKEAIFHASLTADLEADPLGPPHPELVKYFEPPPELVERTAKVTAKLKEALGVKKVSPKMRRMANKDGLKDDEGYIDIDELFDEGDGEPSSSKIKMENVDKGESARATATVERFTDQKDSDVLPVRASGGKPRPGRLISNHEPLEDFNRLIEGDGDVFRKAITDLGEVVKENVEASFSTAAFPLALDCLRAMRSAALTYEEVETYNDYVKDLEEMVKAPGFKHTDFWTHFKNAGKEVGEISSEEARAALEEDYE